MSRRYTGRTIAVSGRTDFEDEIDIAELDDKELMHCVDEARERGLVSHAVTAALLHDVEHDLICHRRAKAQAKLRAAMGNDPVFEIIAAIEDNRINEAIVLIDKFIDPPPSRSAKIIPLDCRPPPPPEPPTTQDIDAILDPEFA